MFDFILTHHDDFGLEGRMVTLPFCPPKGALLYLKDGEGESICYEVVEPPALAITDYGEFLHYDLTRLLLVRLTPKAPYKG